MDTFKSINKLLLLLVFLIFSNSQILLAASQEHCCEKKTPLELSSSTGLSDEELAWYLNEIEKDTAVLTNNRDVLGRVSPKQLQSAIEQLGFTHFTHLYPVILKGEELPDLLGKENSSISIMAVRGGVLKPVPTQIDEFDSSLGWVYISGKSPAPIKGAQGIFDAEDELAFMFRDTGREPYDIKSMNAVKGEIVKEMVFEDANALKRYAYIVVGNDQKSKADYVSFDIDRQKVSTTFYNLSYEPESFIAFKDFKAHVGSAQDQTIVDNIRVDIGASVLAKWARVNLNSSDNIKIEILGVKDGDVRALALAKLKILIAGIQIFSLYTQVNIYDQGIIIPNRTELGSARYFANAIKNPAVRVTLDFVDLQGALVSAEAIYDTMGVGVVDGVMTAEEIKANKSDLPGEWVWMDSKQGWDVFMSIVLPKEMIEGMITALIYEDDPNSVNDYENMPGAHPRIGIRTAGLPDAIDQFHEFELLISLWFPDTVGDGGPAVFNKEVKSPPSLVINDFNLETIAAVEK